MKKTFLALIISFFLSISMQAQTVAGNWKLTSLLVESDMLYSINEPVTLNIDENGKISGNGGCNDYKGIYSFKQPKKPFKKPKKIKFSEIVSTDRDCPRVSDTEKAFLKSLGSAATVVFEGENLVIKDKPTFVTSSFGKVVIKNTLKFVREAKPE